MKKSIKTIFTAWILTGIMLFGTLPGVVTEVYASQMETKITILVDGKHVEFSEEPRLVGGSTMIPLMELAEAMGWEASENSSTVFELAKVVRYTDGVKKYLFSCHAVTINLERRYINRSIMVGVGNFLDTADDHNISLKVTPTVVNGVVFVGVRDLVSGLYATVDWDGKTNTVSIKSGTIPYYDGQGLTNREELFEKMRKYYKINRALTKVSGESTDEPVNLDETEKPKVTSLFQPAGVMTSAPETGSFPAKILMTGKTDVNAADSYQEPYKYSVGHGCNWYGFGRFYEVYGYRIAVPYTGGLTYLDAVAKADNASVRAERDPNKIISGCLAVYWRKNNGGHVVFVEYVERDADGNPVSVYYTECMNTDGSGVYKPKSDAKVKKVSFERFKKSSSGTKDLMGYVLPK